MPNASAKYILGAEDRTQAAVRSVRAGFESIDKSAKALTKGFSGLGKLLGVGGVVGLGMKAFGALSREADTAIQNLAKSNADFARMLDETNKNFERMNVAGAATITAQTKLNEISKDPSLVNAMRQGADFAGRFKTELQAMGPAWQIVIGRAAEYLNLIEKAPPPPTVGPSSRGFPDTRDLGDVDTARTAGRAATKSFDDRIKAEAEAAKAAIKEAEEANKRYQEYLDDVAAGIVRAHELGQEAAKNGLNIIDPQMLEDTRADQFLESLQEGFEKAPEWVKESTDEMSTYADQAARNMQDAFADFLFDPFQDGLKGMLKGFLNVIRRMVAEQAAAKIFGSKESGGLGLGGLITGAVGALFGGPRANGGPVDMGRSYLVGERGPELFTPGRSGTITPNGAGKSVVIHSAPTINVNAAQLTQDQAARMVADSQRMMWDELDRRYGIA